MLRRMAKALSAKVSVVLEVERAELDRRLAESRIPSPSAWSNAGAVSHRFRS
jgi:hypothetical protein